MESNLKDHQEVTPVLKEMELSSSPVRPVKDSKRRKLNSEKSTPTVQDNRRPSTRVRTLKEFFKSPEEAKEPLVKEETLTVDISGVKELFQQDKDISSDTCDMHGKENSGELNIGLRTPNIKDSKKPKGKRKVRSASTKKLSADDMSAVEPNTAITPLKDVFSLKEHSEESPKSEKKIQKVCRSAKSCKSGGPHPSPRWGHSFCFTEPPNAIIIGGQGDKQVLSKDSIWELQTETKQWRPLKTTSVGPNPEARMGHTATYDPVMRCIYIYGGSKNVKWFSDVHVLELDELKWQLVKANGKAPTRAYHTATLYRHELWMFGGVFPRPDPQPDGSSNEIEIFSPVMESWYNPIVTGEKPEPRSGHSATIIGDQLVVFGGWDFPVCFSDIHILDMGFVEWTKPNVNGTPPAPRSWHAACALTGKRVLIHGGYDGNNAMDDSFIFNLDTMAWTCVNIDFGIPARVGHTIQCLPYKNENQDKEEILIFGGGDNEGSFFNDLFDLHLPLDL
ncbi:acyl-CoA-binding domain-containing protein 5 [Lingula anatina]|uniref:Acyl-CoA-binding domain-containing protein 5 n=1 Tax=Lingula anatina TaxID=7574 RepID=A0A1S3JPK1_LINAN|nr:acyl-CoA-binding domain-containing protein 5 [Lingula anatina]|eukprot:XP_013412282.1 acyl-CoA-binding domain-containing protein 5 [Lingula anatina]